jgi:hypothetical protein
VKIIFAIGYYCLHGILIVPNLTIALPFEVFPTTEISVIFHHISLAFETPNQSPLKLVTKMDHIAT